MADKAQLTAERRTNLGSSECRRLRRKGVVPGNIYGHGRETISLSVPEESLDLVVRAGHKVFDVAIGGAAEKVMFREVQWDTFGTRIQHFDLIRIDADEQVTVEVPLELRGIASGTQAGGRLQQPLRTLTVECLAVQIPDSIEIRIGELEIGQSICVRDIDPPPGAAFKNPPESTVIHIAEPIAEEEETESDEIAPAEPEVIGRKEEDSDSADAKDK